MPSRPLPPALRTRAFTVRDGSATGLSKARMGGADLARPTYAVRTVTPPVTLTDLARATSVGLPLPRELERGPLHVMRATHVRGSDGPVASRTRDSSPATWSGCRGCP